MGGPIYSEEQRGRFFEILDRGGTVRAAARSAGVSEHAAYRWVSASGLSMFRATPRKYTSEEKAGLLTVWLTPDLWRHRSPLEGCRS